MRKIFTLLLFLCFITNLYAGFNGVTHHSRANCANNESISWDWTQNWWFWVNSEHYDARSGTIVHELVSRWQLTWRNAMVHWGEGTYGWGVEGFHWMRNRSGDPVLVYREYVNDCSIYDGWWDKKEKKK